MATISGRVFSSRSYRSGTSETTANNNAVTWVPSPSHFGNLNNAAGKTTVQWVPSPAHFGTKLPLGTVTLTLSGTGVGTTTTDALEFYSFSGLAVGQYTVTPSLAGYVFEPPSQTFTISDSVNAINFNMVPA